MRARLLPLLAVAVAAPAWAAELNVITSIEVKDMGPEVVLSVQGTRKPSFTTFSMADPPQRFVIDFSESKFQGVAEQTKGDGGIVQHVKAMSYGSGANAIARVMITFAVEVDPPAVEDEGDKLLVRIPKPAGAAVAAAPEADAGADAKVAAAADAKAKADADAKAKADADAKAKADAEAKAKADADAKAQAKADADAKAKADADAKAQAKADADAKAKADADAKAQAKADADAKAKADADAKAQAKADADAKAKADADAKAQAKADADAKAKADDEGKAGTDADQKALDAEIAAARAEASTAPSRDVERVAPSGGPATLREVGFKQFPDVSRVFVRTSAPAQAIVQEVDERTIRIELANTLAKRGNDLRFMDTSFFSSAVQMITPSRQGSSYVLTVKLRQRVPYQQKQEGDLLTVDFQRPPATASAPPPAGVPDSGAPSGSPEE